MTKLELFFLNAEGRTVKQTVDNPVEPVDPETVNAVMDEIIEQNVFTSSGGDLVAKKEARIVVTEIEDIELDIE